MTFSTEYHESDSSIDIIKHNMKRHKMLITITLDENGTYERRQAWSDLKTETIYRLGYRKAEKFLDRLAFTGTPAYIKMIGFKEAEAPNLETSSTLADFYMSDAPRDFMKGLTKTSFPTLDKKQIVMMIPIAIGAILGVYLLFGR